MAEAHHKGKLKCLRGGRHITKEAWEEDRWSSGAQSKDGQLGFIPSCHSKMFLFARNNDRPLAFQIPFQEKTLGVVGRMAQRVKELPTKSGDTHTMEGELTPSCVTGYHAQVYTQTNK